MRVHHFGMELALSDTFMFSSVLITVHCLVENSVGWKGKESYRPQNKRVVFLLVILVVHILKCHKLVQ